jgi:RimJ/RimL family protein N-acetyltransferase
MLPENIASERVAIKCGYRKEGLLQKALLHKDGSKRDCLLYAKTM